MRIVPILVAVAALAAWPAPPAVAQNAKTPEELQRQVDELNERVAKLEAALAALQPVRAQPAPAVPPEQAALPVQPSVPASVGGGDVGAAASSKVFNPDMAVIGNFLGVAGKNPVDPSKAFEMRETEASFQAAVDPYARADFFLSFGESGVNLEEGFITFTTLPGGLLVKAGKMRAAFGKVNTLHTHVLPWADRPLVTTNLVGGEDGISDAGVSVARLIPAKGLFMEATGQVFRGDSENVFVSHHASDLSYVGHLRAYRDITEDANIDLGVSYARGQSFFVDDHSTLVGIDATFRWKPLQRSIYHSFVGRSEVIWNQTPHPVGPSSGSGFYVSGDYQFARRWFAGARFDASDRASNLALRDHGGSASVTFWPSEFSQVRGQYRHTTYAGDQQANELLFQLQFSIGAHGAHPF